MKKLIKKMASIDENITPNLGVTESDDTVALQADKMSLNFSEDVSKPKVNSKQLI